ncbi:MAG: ABC transporter ATP-binding protein [Steroidobacter sp.]
MRLTDISYRPGADLWLDDVNLCLTPGAVNVLLGATLAGKTTLLRIMAGLDRPTRGRVSMGERDLTGIPVRKRNVAMVYQQFINYPSLTVFENIASPLRVARRSEAEIRTRVGALAETLRIAPFLSRYPSELSGGQQQRTALARALARDSELLLLDEPLVNLDYKLREELRGELTQLFAQRETTVVYATTEPQEALQLGGNTAVLAEGRLLQFGATAHVFRRPTTLAAARAFSDPPLNVISAAFDRETSQARLDDGLRLSLPSSAGRIEIPAQFQLAIRAHDFSFTRTSPRQAAIDGHVELAEISGSETYVHLTRDRISLIAQAPGVHDFALNQACTFFVDPADLYGFDLNGQLLFASEFDRGPN